MTATNLILEWCSISKQILELKYFFFDFCLSLHLFVATSSCYYYKTPHHLLNPHIGEATPLQTNIGCGIVLFQGVRLGIRD